MARVIGKFKQFRAVAARYDCENAEVPLWAVVRPAKGTAASALSPPLLPSSGSDHESAGKSAASPPSTRAAGAGSTSHFRWLLVSVWTS